MSNSINQWLPNENENVHEVLLRRFEESRRKAAKVIKTLICKKLSERFPRDFDANAGREPEVTSEMMEFLAQYIGCSERTVRRQIEYGTVQDQQKPGRDFAIKLAFALDLKYADVQGLLASTAHPMLRFSDTSPDSLRDYIIAKWLFAEESSVSDGTRLTNCIAELNKYNCAIL